LAVDFLKPARIDDALEIETRMKAIGGATITLAQVVRHAESAAALVTAEVTVALVDMAGKPQRMPRDLRARLSAREAG
jgi:acyl-CoA thioester hydrolase